MPRPPVADFEIDGKPYVLARPPYGIRLGFASDEPAAAGEVGTIEIPTFHLGGGEFLAQSPGRFFTSKWIEAGVPGQVGRIGLPSELAYGIFETPAASVAVAFDAVSSGSAAAVGGPGSASIIVSHTVGVGTNRLLLAAIAFGTANGSPFSVTYGGVSMSLIAEFELQLKPHRIQIWGLLNPATGTADISATWGNGHPPVVLTGTSYANVDPSNPWGTLQ